MATITLGGEEIQTVGELPAVGEAAPAFTLTNTDLQDVSFEDVDADFIVLNIFPSIDTGVCQASVREFNERAADLDGVEVLCVSADLPFAHKRFCGAEGIEGVAGMSTFRSDFGTAWGVEIADGAFAGLLSRAVVVLDADGKVVHTEQVAEIGEEPDYEAALAHVG
ncbi:thiol peroxidase [Persicimonas caeni]|uniref:Thiol peroxidase n=1 Tax=Persicimonas caeni TaxID=2292766 RepID=A0A4Y6PMT3_PERCE|nr:thiol peroxidase [Persicimonas caeni]QDG49616.1 thiol peroxidase [Persicimonas caeni]QED30837.1 thiol peroxidase [Persicimonas caeni]